MQPVLKSIKNIATPALISSVVFFLICLVYWPQTLSTRDTAVLSKAIANHPSDDYLKTVAISVMESLNAPREASMLLAVVATVFALGMMLAWFSCLLSLRKIRKQLNNESGTSPSLKTTD